jgi:hypothetical protein
VSCIPHRSRRAREVCSTHCGAAIGVSKSPSRLRCLSRWRSIFVQPSSPERWRSSSALRLVGPKLAASPQSTVGMHAKAVAGVRVVTTMGVHDCTCDDAGAPPKQCIDYRLWDGFWILVMTIWSTSERHCSAASGEASRPGRLLRSARAMTCMASRPATGGGITTMVVER